MAVSPRLDRVHCLDDGTASGEGIDAPGLAINNFSIGIDQHCQRHFALPFGIEGVDEFIALRRCKEQIATGSLVLLRKARTAFCSSGAFTDTMANSKSRCRYMRLMVMNSSNSATHGAHHVAQKLTSRNLPDLFARKSLSVSSFAGEIETGSPASFSI